MLRIEAYTVMGGIALRVGGICTTDHRIGGRCNSLSTSTLVRVEEVEQLGAHLALLQGIRGCLEAYPDISDLAMH